MRMAPMHRVCRLLLFVSVFCLAYSASAQAQALDVRAQLRRLPPIERDDVLWLARCVYSESDRAHEQRLVAWVVRNRVETSYRGTTYRDVVLEPRQFSAFNEPSLRRTHILGLDENSPSAAWRQALEAALEVYHAPASQRPFPQTTRHFYSPVSMDGGRTPHWAVGVPSLSSTRLGVDPYRFRFFNGLDEGLEGTPASVVSAAPSTVRASTERTLKRRPRLRATRFSGRVKRPARPHLTRDR